MIERVIKVMKLEEVPTSGKTFDCQENVTSFLCVKCDFSSHTLLSLIQHRKAGCENKVNNLNFLLDAYKCGNCEFVSCSCIITSRHQTRCCMFDNTSTSLWVCSHCDFTVSYNLDYNKFECGGPECSCAYTKIEELKLHATFVHLPKECLTYFLAGEQVESCACDHHGEELKRKLELDKVNTRLFTCDKCEFKCKKRDYLVLHKIIKHTETPNRLDIKWFECQECPYRAKTKNTLRNHKINRHTPTENIKWFECDECGFKSKVGYQLNRHKFRKHALTGQVKRFECQECDYKCKTRMDLNLHKICKHTLTQNIKWFECQQCAYQSKTKSSLRKHKMYRHTPSENIKWFECQECEYKSKTGGDLRRHQISKHTSAKDIKWFECQECGHKSKRRDHLKTHRIKKHSPTENMAEYIM